MAWRAWPGAALHPGEQGLAACRGHGSGGGGECGGSRTDAIKSYFSDDWTQSLPRVNASDCLLLFVWREIKHRDVCVGEREKNVLH